ncbi:oxidoreductase [bacterium]|nr:oxidoreductase [bacterium]
MSLSEKIIVITGGNGLLGTAMIESIRQAGGTALIADISCEDDPGSGKFELDITSEDSVKTCIKNILEHYGRIDGWVNNAYPRTKDWGAKWEDIPMESWRENIDMHLNGYYLCSRHVLSQMKEQGNGSLINMASIYGFLGPDFSLYEGTDITMPAAYAAIKGGIINLTRYMASYFGPDGIRVNSVSPGGIYDNQSPAFVQNYNERVPLRRMGNPDDIGPPVAFLLSENARYITGQNLVVDGGWSIK